MTRNHPVLQKRPPIVSVLGHVDHGKTTLLDFIRKTRISEKEVGGITQSIGASVVEVNGEKITFIDTPGHAAFSKMRSRGAKVSDIAILVVAADDGVQPQTKEALQHILDAKIPFIVAATKIDLPTSSLDNVRKGLENEGVRFEGSGGDVPLIGVSAKTGQGVKDLLEMILLVSEIYEIKADFSGPLEAVIIEAGKGKAGPLVTAIIRNGKIKVGDEIVSEGISAKVKAIFNHLQKPVKEVYPGEPAQILGFESLPPVGSLIRFKGEAFEGEKKEEIKTETFSKKEGMPIVLKVNNIGSLEAILVSLPQKISVVSSGVGDVSESDIFLAKSSGAKIFTFSVRTPQNVLKLAESEGIFVRNFEIIYELLENIEELVKEKKVEFIGKCEILKIFSFENKKIAGCRVVFGKISSKDLLILKRGEEILGEVRILSLRKGKIDVNEVSQKEECGILFTPQLDFRVGDVLLSQGVKK